MDFTPLQNWDPPGSNPALIAKFLHQISTNPVLTLGWDLRVGFGTNKALWFLRHQGRFCTILAEQISRQDLESAGSQELLNVTEWIRNVHLDLGPQPWHPPSSCWVGMDPGTNSFGNFRFTSVGSGSHCNAQDLFSCPRASLPLDSAPPDSRAVPRVGFFLPRHLGAVAE